jgi:adenylate cyclase
MSFLKGLAFGALAAALAYLAAASGRGEIIEATTYDWRLAGSADPAKARSDIAIVEIDEASVRRLEPAFGRWPWPRFAHAGVINFLSRAGARVIVYDVVFSEPDFLGRYQIGGQEITGNASDAELVSAVRRAGNVILTADAVFPGTQGVDATAPLHLPGTIYTPGPGLVVRPNVKEPFDALRQAAPALGHNYLQKDDGGVSRRMAPFIEHNGVAIPSLGLAAVLLANTVPADAVRMQAPWLRVGDAMVPVLDGHGQRAPGAEMLLNMHGPMVDAISGRQTYPAYQFFNVLLSEQNIVDGTKPEIDPAAFRDKIVFVGTSATGLADVHATPFGGNTPGVFLHAALADDVLSRQFMRRASPGADLALTAGVGLAAGVLAMTLPVWWAVAAVTALAAGIVTWAHQAVGHGLWLPVVGPVLAAALALLLGLSWQYFVEGREKRQVKRLFGRYVSKDVFDRLMADPALARLGGERREMTVLFSDIRGFTSASENASPEAVVLQLNEYFSEMVAVLFRHHGTLDKFVGDMVMGLFGAPVTDPRHADHAVRAAVEMVEKLAELNARWKTEGRPTLDIGIGINSGEMIAGNIGSEAIMSYTVIGDAVNLGSRIESLNKEYGTHILISQATKDQLTVPTVTRLVGEAHVKGRARGVTIYEVTSMERPASAGPGMEQK